MAAMDYEFDPNSESDNSGMRRDDHGFDSDDSRVHIKSKKSEGGLGFYNMLKILNVLVYQVTLAFTIGYFLTTKYRSWYTVASFWSILITRPVIILIYWFFHLCLECRRSNKPAKKKDRRKDDDSDMSMQSEEV